MGLGLPSREHLNTGGARMAANTYMALRVVAVEIEESTEWRQAPCCGPIEYRHPWNTSPMPIAYVRDDWRRLTIVTANEPCSVDDILQVIDRRWSDGTLDYAVLYDLRALPEASAETDLQQIAITSRPLVPKASEARWASRSAPCLCCSC